MPKTCDIACVRVYVCACVCILCACVRALVYVVKSRQSTPTSATIRVDPFGEGRMGESCLPHSVLHEKVLTLRKLCVRLVHPTKVKSWESYKPTKTLGCVRSLVKRMGTIAYISNQVVDAVQYDLTLHIVIRGYNSIDR